MDDMDLATLEMEELVIWLFDRPARPEDEGGWFTDYIFHTARPGRVLEMLAAMFVDFRKVAETYSRQQIEQGLWALLSGAGLDVGKLLARGEVPLDARLAFIEASCALFGDVVAKLSPPMVEHYPFMWWDLICGAFWFEVHHREPELELPRNRRELEALLAEAKGLANFDVEAWWKNLSPEKQAEQGKRADDARAAEAAKDLAKALRPDEFVVREAMFRALQRILAMDSRACRASALHGLGHVHHPGAAPVVKAFMERCAESGEQWDQEWLQMCRDGTVL